MKLEPKFLTQIRYSKKGFQTYLVTYYYDDNSIIKLYKVKDTKHLLDIIADTLDLPSSYFLIVEDFNEYAVVSLRNGWDLYYKSKQYIFNFCFYLMFAMHVYFAIIVTIGAYVFK